MLTKLLPARPNPRAAGHHPLRARGPGAILVSVTGLALLAATGTASPPAREPAIAVPAAKLRSSLHCQRQVRNARRTPVLLVTGTGIDGSEAWPSALQKSLTKAGRPSCYVDFPQHTTGDVQIAAEYLVGAIRATERRARRPIAIYGISQGGLLPRWALTYWPSTRRLVTDVVAVAGTQHGTTIFNGLVKACRDHCRFTAAAWQQAAGSNLERAIARVRDETPGPTSWTTVRSLTDEVVQPVAGPHPASALRGASNVVIQKVCGGRVVSHITTATDSVSYAVLIDALTHRGPARVGRLRAGVCARAFAPGLDPGKTRALIVALYGLAAPRTLLGAGGGTLLRQEPRVRGYARG